MAAAVVGVLLAMTTLGMEGVRTELKRRQAIALMAVLDQALIAYHQATGQWPGNGSAVTLKGESPAPTAVQAHMEGSGDRMVGRMMSVPGSRAALEGVPQVLRAPAGGPEDDSPNRQAWGTVRDPWGRQLHCLTAASPLVTHRKAVAANQGRPIFVSAGPDGRFGYAEVSAASDNIRSDEIRE